MGTKAQMMEIGVICQPAWDVANLEKNNTRQERIL
jgi:hypothetical protein